MNCGDDLILSKIILDYQPIVGKNCFYSALYNSLRYYNAGIEEAELYFLCNGYKCLFNPDSEYNRKTHTLLQYIPYEVQLELLSNKIDNFTYTINESPDLNNFLQSTTISLKENKLILLLVKPHILNYQTVQISLNHNYHCILAHGVDLKEKKLFIADSYVLDEKGTIKSYNGLLNLEELKDNIIGSASVFYTGKKKEEVPMFQELSAYAEYSDSDNGFDTLVTAIRYLKEYAAVHNDYKRSEIYKLIYIFKARFLCIYDYLLIYTEGGDRYKKLYNKIIDLKNLWNTLFVKLLIIYESGYKVNAFDKMIHFAEMLTEKNRQLIKEIVRASGEI
jgi:hypothetical protein